MEQSYKQAFIISFVLHVIVLVVMATQLSFKPAAPKQSAAASVQPIKAVSVNAAQVAAKMAELKAEQQAKQQAELQRQRLLNQQAVAAKRQRELEQQRLNQLKAEAQKLQQQRAAEAKAETQRLAKLKAQQVAEQKRLNEIAKQRQVQEAKAAQDAKLAKQQDLAKQAEQQQKLEEDRLLQQQLVADQQQLEQDKRQAMQGVIDKYTAMILNAISQQWIVPENMPKDLSAKLLVQLAPGGVVLDVKLVQSSGNPVLDRSAIAAVRKASPLPVPQDPSLMNEFKEINMTVRPEGVVPG